MYTYITLDKDDFVSGYVSVSTEFSDENNILINENEDPNTYFYKKYNRETKEFENITEEEYKEHYGDLNEPSLEERMVAALEYYNLIVE